MVSLIISQDGETLPVTHFREGLKMKADEVDIVKVLSSCLRFSFMPNSILEALVKMRLLACIFHKSYLSLSIIRGTFL